MVKTTFAKLGLKTNLTTNQFDWNDTESFEVKIYLPIDEKLSLIERVINQAQETDKNILLNPLKLEMFTKLEILYTYTNIVFTEKQKENPTKIYDAVKSTGLLEQVLDLIPKSELTELINSLILTAKEIYKYNQSALAIFDTITQDYSNLDFDATKIQQALADPDNLSLLKDIVTKIG